MNDLDTLVPRGIELVIDGEPLVIKPLKVGQLPGFLRAISPVMQQISSIEIDWLALFGERGDDLLSAIAREAQSSVELPPIAEAARVVDEPEPRDAQPVPAHPRERRDDCPWRTSRPHEGETLGIGVARMRKFFAVQFFDPSLDLDAPDRTPVLGLRLDRRRATRVVCKVGAVPGLRRREEHQLVAMQRVEHRCRPRAIGAVRRKRHHVVLRQIACHLMR